MPIFVSAPARACQMVGISSVNEKMDETARLQQTKADLREGLQNAKRLVEQTKSLLTGAPPADAS